MKKKLNYSLLILIGILFISCSNDNPNDQSVNGNLNKWIIKEYNSNNELIYFNEYLVSNNRISSFITYNSDDNFESILSETVYTYENDKIAQIADFYFGNFGLNDRETNFIYNNSILTEYETQTLNTNFVNKVTFEHNGNNTILTKYRSADNGQTFELIDFGPITELTFDNNDNLILTKPPGPIGSDVNYVDAIEYDYDNSNLMNVSKYPSTELDFTYTNKQNPISLVFTNTFGKKGFSLIHSPNSLLFWNNLSPNVLNSLSGNGIGTYSIDNNFVNDTLTRINITLDSFSDGSIDSRIIHEFEYE
jgi:hypothetical protein